MCALSVLGLIAGSIGYKVGQLPAFFWAVAWHLGSAAFLWSRVASRKVTP